MGEYYSDAGIYDDIINMPYHKSNKRANMSMHDRAGQFGSFKALNGHEDAIGETARLTDEKIELTDIEIEKINEKLKYLSNHIQDNKIITVTYFKNDLNKEGGEYKKCIGSIKKINTMEKCLIMHDKTKIQMENIINIDM